MDPLSQSSSLIEHYKTHTELQTELTLCKSNLTMAQANNEMLEDALRRDSARAKNVGWGRQSVALSVLDDDGRSTKSLDAERPATPKQPTNVSPTIHPPQGQEGRFFKFRFGSTTPSSSSGFSTPNGVHPSHLSSASLPSLSSKDDEIEKLTLELEKQRKECKTALEEKKKVEDELESLSQALFEEVCVRLEQALSYTNEGCGHVGEQNGGGGTYEGRRPRRRTEATCFGA